LQHGIMEGFQVLLYVASSASGARLPITHAVGRGSLAANATHGNPCARCESLRALLTDELLHTSAAVTLTNAAGTLEYRGDPFRGGPGNDFALEVRACKECCML
jgi:hypothetical protein